MARDWEATFRSWSKPSSETEAEKCQNAEGMIRDAIRGHTGLRNVEVDVFSQGSYRNNTNVRLESDVDICVCCMSSFFYDLSHTNGLTEKDLHIEPARLHFPEYKDEVERALVAHFGRDSIQRGNKAFDIHENTYRVDADAVPCFEHRQYDQRRGWVSGTAFLSDKDGRKIVNWPKQHYERGVKKNEATGKRFKFITRILKRLRNEMEETGIAAAASTPSFLIECLVWNVPDSAFGAEQYRDDVRAVVLAAYNETKTDDACRSWREVNQMKLLFGSGQPWTRQQANEFLVAAWGYAALK